MKILLMLLMLAVVTDYGWASNNTRRHKPHTKHLRTQGMLHPFVLRLLYTPSYRLLSQHWQDRAAEGETVAQLLPPSGWSRCLSLLFPRCWSEYRSTRYL